MNTDGNLTIYITNSLTSDDSTVASIGYGDINVEPLIVVQDTTDPENPIETIHHCPPTYMTEDTVTGDCSCSDAEQTYDANSKQCCHSSCTRCYGPDESQCIFTMGANCDLGEPRTCGQNGTFYQYYGGLDRCGANNEFT